jgi:hypothetical protein
LGTLNVRSLQMACSLKTAASELAKLEKPGWTRPLCRWEDNITLDLRETGRVGEYWIYLVQDRDQ